MLGNISNPSISRWGINLFWYKYWFQDFYKQLNIQKDIIFETLVYYYIFFGFQFSHNHLKNIRWLSSKHFPKDDFKNFTLQYYREVEISNKYNYDIVLDIFRIKSSDLLHSRFWLMKFQNWIIINFYAFQPNKRNKLSVKKFDMKTAVVTEKKKSYSFIKKFKFLTFFYNYFIKSLKFSLYKF